MTLKRILFLFLTLLLAGCSVRNDLAPVSDIRGGFFSSFKTTHIVRRGETLYAIAFHYDSDYRQLAQLNHLRPPYSLRIGQVLNVRGLTRKQQVIRPRYPTRYNPPARPVKPIHSSSIWSRSSSGWAWPANGHVTTSFIPNQGKKGINIASKKGEMVHAASSGIVAYAGSGLSGYGNLIIIKHNNEYLTAYGNNSRNLVSEGQQVKQGQVIAAVGIVDHKYWGLHFEIRKAGRPVNPLNYLQKG